MFSTRLFGYVSFKFGFKCVISKCSVDYVRFKVSNTNLDYLILGQVYIRRVRNKWWINYIKIYLLFLNPISICYFRSGLELKLFDYKDGYVSLGWVVVSIQAMLG